MTIYHYNSGTLIDEVRVVTNVAGGVRAYVQARPGTTQEQLAPVLTTFADLGWKGVPHIHDGVPAFELRGFKDKDELFNLLGQKGWVAGTPTATPTKEDKISSKDKLRNMTLKATGAVYNVGDIAYMTYARKNYLHETSELKNAHAITAEGVAKLNQEAMAFNKLNAKAPTLLQDLKEVTLESVEALNKEVAAFNRGKKKSAQLKQFATKEKLIADGVELVKAAKMNIGAGIGYALGGIVLTFFGSKDQSNYEIKATAKKTKAFLQQAGADIPAESSLEKNTQDEKGGPATKLKHFLTRYPSEILNVIYTGVGLFIAAQSYKAYKVTGDRSDRTDIGLGAITTLSSLAGIFIKEKKRPEGEPKRGGLQGAWDWVQEKPLRATGYGFMVATAFHAHASYEKYMQGDKIARETVLGRAVFVAANVVAEILMAVSSKGHGHGVKTDNTVTNTVLENAAEVIALQAPDKQEKLINDLSDHLSSPKILGGKKNEIAESLQKKVDTMEQNPWSYVATHKAAEPKEVPHSKVSHITHAEKLVEPAHAAELV